MHTVFALLCFVVVIHWLIFPYPSGLLYWHCGNLTIAPVPAKQPWWIWINTSCEFIMNDCINTTKQSTTKPCAYFLGYTVCTRLALCRDWLRFSNGRFHSWWRHAIMVAILGFFTSFVTNAVFKWSTDILMQLYCNVWTAYIRELTCQKEKY